MSAETTTMTKEQVVTALISKIRGYQKKVRDCEVEICVGLVELERLKAHEVLPPYKTFAELAEGEFGWSEIKFRSARAVLLKYGMEKYRDFGRESLQAIARLEDVEQNIVFGKCAEYRQRKAGKQASYSVIAGWIRDIRGAVQDKDAPTNLVDIKAKYLKVLEENRVLREEVQTLKVQIVKLHRLLDIKNDHQDPPATPPRTYIEAETQEENSCLIAQATLSN